MRLSGNGRYDLGVFGNPPGSDGVVPRAGLASGFTAGGFIQNSSQRAGAAALVVVLHAAVIALVLLSRAKAPVAQTPGLAAFDIAIGQERAQIPHPGRPHHTVASTPPNPIQFPVIDLTSLALVQPSLTEPTALDIQPASFSAGAGCDLTEAVQDALRRNVELKSRLPDIPEDRRSIANAIVLWNAGWMDPGAAPAQSAFAAIRQTIAQTVQASSADCRRQLQFGPRLLYLPTTTGKSGDNPGRTIVLALGSGRWTWQQLIGSGQPLSPGAAQTLVAPPPLAQLATAQPAAPKPDPSPAMNAMLASLIRKPTPAGLPYYP